MMMQHDLITEPLLSWRDASRIRHRATLPGVLAALSSGELTEFPAARAHQFHPWSMFLAQLAAIALYRGGQATLPTTETEWGDLLLGLTAGAHEPWALVVSDLAKPAFFQPPVPEESLDGWRIKEHPDDLDMLVTTKNHDVKQSQMPSQDVEAWVLALVTLQTMQGYAGGGGGYNGIARMKSGYGSRPRVGLAPDHRLASRFRRDVAVMLETWDRLLERGFSPEGAALLWLVPWTGASSLSWRDLSPHFIEICWRTRCVSVDEQIRCCYTTTDTRRALADSKDGDVGDPWIPIEREGGALTVGKSGFNYVLMRQLTLDGKYARASAQESRPGDPPSMWLTAAVLSRGQGKTEGLRERELLLPPKIRAWMTREESKLAFARRADQWIDRASTMRSEVLNRALMQLALDTTAPPDHFDDRVDEVFFSSLFVTVELPDEAAQLIWERQLSDLAWNELQKAIDFASVSASRWYRAVTSAEGAFHGCLARHFRTLVESDSASPREINV